MCTMYEKDHQEQQKSTELFNRGFLAASKEFEYISTSKQLLLTAKSFRWLSPWDLNAA